MTVAAFVQDGALGELGSELLGKVSGVPFGEFGGADEVLAHMRAGLTEEDRDALVLLLGEAGAECWLLDLATFCIQARQAGGGSHGS